jgi:hypothetical protein
LDNACGHVRGGYREKPPQKPPPNAAAKCREELAGRIGPPSREAGSERIRPRRRKRCSATAKSHPRRRHRIASSWQRQRAGLMPRGLEP